MTDKKLFKLALDALTYKKWFCLGMGKPNDPKLEAAITALKERLAQEKALQALHNENERLGLYKDAYAEQEPVGEVGWAANVPNTIREVHWKNGSPPIGTKLFTHPPQRTEPVCPECKAEVLYECVACSSNNYPPQRTEQEPVAWCSQCGHKCLQQRPWVGMTGQEIDDIDDANWEEDHKVWGIHEFARAIEAKLKEKNT